MLVVSVLLAGATSRLPAVAESVVKSGETAVTLALGLIGIMSVWLGMMRLAEKAGLIQSLSSALRPVLRWLFPEVPRNHPAMGAIVMNIAANMLGLSNAATPLGLRAMQELEKLNTRPGVATNAMCTFLAINTSSVQLIPITAIGILAAAGALQPQFIIGTALLATACSTVAGIVSVKILEQLPVFRLSSDPITPSHQQLPTADAETVVTLSPWKTWHWVVILALILCFAMFLVNLIGSQSAPHGDLFPRIVNAFSILAVPFLLTLFPICGWLRGLKVYEEFVEGAKEGFHVAIRIIPFLVAMLLAIGMFRAAGGIDLIADWTRPALQFLHFPTELLPISLMRPLSGSGSLALFSELVKQHGPDSLIARTAGTLYGSTETTFYVLAIYFGSVSIRRTRHALPAGLIADGVGIIASIAICRWLMPL